MNPDAVLNEAEEEFITTEMDWTSTEKLYFDKYVLPEHHVFVNWIDVSGVVVMPTKGHRNHDL